LNKATLAFIRLFSGRIVMFSACFWGSRTNEVPADASPGSGKIFSQPRPSDEEIVRFEDSVKKEAIVAQPLISAQLPIELVVEEEYSGQGAFAAKLHSLRSIHGFGIVRKCRGDGSCFYRAAAFALLEHFQLSSCCETRNSIRDTWDELLKTVGFEPLAYEDFSEAFWDLAASTHTPDELASHIEANEYAANMALMYLRLLTSAEIRKHPNLYAAFIESSPAGESDTSGLARWCERNVEAVGVEADQVQLIALGRSVRADIVVANLGAAAAEEDLQVSEFKAEAEAVPVTVISLLYRPGHYDLLYQTK
jgi:ubiquitin thioesterase protein OTUB1